MNYEVMVNGKLYEFSHYESAERFENLFLDEIRQDYYKYAQATA